MSVRAKFRCQGKLELDDGTSRIVLDAVYGNGDPNHENTQFFRATPSGVIQLGVVNPEASAAFTEGQEYYVDFTPAPTT